MIVQSFKSVLWVGAVAGAAISCYMVSLQVAAERAHLERVETRILIAKRDIRNLDTELSTRARLRQLERWNSDVLALTAPTEGQFLSGEVQLAGLGRVDPARPLPTDADVQDAARSMRSEQFMHADAAPTAPPPTRTVFAGYKPLPDPREEKKDRADTKRASATTKAAKRKTADTRSKPRSTAARDAAPDQGRKPKPKSAT